MLSNHFITKCIPGKDWRGMQRWLCMVAVLIIGWLQFAQPANAQPVITRVEYFIDNDPGFGNATALTISSGTDLQNLTIPVNPTSLSQGVHTLFARARSANGWGLSNKWIFYKPFNAGSGGTTPNITRVEYFIDTDPGFGNATALTIGPGTDLQNLTIPVNPTAMSQGVHTLYARARSANGWGLVNKWIFYKPFNAGSGGTAPNISRVEYFIDTDPGLGNATAITITPGTDLQNLTIPINPATLTEGVHTLFARARSANGWGLVNKWIFYKPFSSNATLPAPNLVTLEYYIDTDPGLGNGNPVSITNQQDLASLPVAVNISTLASGDHQLHVRAKDGNGNWSLVNTLDFNIPSAVTGNSVVVSSIDKTTFCSSETLKVSYDANGTFTGANTFKVFLSNASGSFTSEREIGSVTTTVTSGIINCSLPGDITAGTGYKVRIKSSSPATTGPANASAITISQAAVPSVSIGSNLGVGVCAGSNITFTATPTNGGVSPTYVWKVNGTDVATGPSYQSTTLSSGDVVTAVLTSSVACVSSPTATSNAITVQFANVTPTVSIAADPGTTICAGTSVTLTATPTNGGTSPSYAWYINNVYYTSGVSFGISTLANGDVVKCELTSNIACASPATVTSNTLTFVVQAGVTYYQDADGDGYGNINAPLSSCAQPAGYVTNSTDCNDGNAAINPTTVWYKDTDNDGYSNGTSVTQCARPTGYKYAAELVATSGDCNDANAAVHPGVTEICGNSIDDNCNGQTDEGSSTYYRDADGDGYGNPAITIVDCSQPAGYVGNNTDCDDANAAIHAQFSFYVDNDGDGFGVGSLIGGICAVNANTAPSGYATNNTDCDDNSSVVHASFSFYVDNDGDGFGVGNLVTGICAVNANTAPSGYATNNTDCDDNSSVVHATFSFYVDNDGDGFGVGNLMTGICAINANTAPSGYATNNTDCDDNNSLIHAQFSFYVDNDGDGFGVGNLVTGICAVNANTAPSGYATNNTDCDDNNSLIHAQFSFYVDNDGDGYGVPGSQLVCAVNGNTPPSGYATNSTDCDDNNASIHQQFSFYLDNDGDGFGVGSLISGICAQSASIAPSGYSTNNTDCNDNNASINTGCATYTWYLDADGDGYGDPEISTTTDENVTPTGYVSNGSDCNDDNAAINPSTVWYKDADNDGYSDGSSLTQCTQPASYKLASSLTAISGDCNDANAAINPGATEVCNGIDDNCNGSIDEGVTTTFYQDADGDGYGNLLVTTQACSAPTGYVTNSVDCDDANAAINPTTVWYKDADSDGYSDGTTATQCAQPSGYKLATALTATSGDCNDANAAINPAATEICGNGVDENCNGMADDVCPNTFTWYQDSDGDGYGNPDVSTTTTTDAAPDGYVKNSSDCDDASATINPATIWYKDADNDGYSDGSSLTQCTQPASYKLASSLSATSGDCNDANAAINPGATEVCNGIDDNCNGSIDEGVTTTFYRDADGDGYGNLAVTTQGCSAPTGYVTNSADCDDANAAINPTTVWYKDADNDDYSDGTTATQCAQPSGYKLATTLTSTSGDCNDANAAINPAATEICGNGVDENCNGMTDDECIGVFTWYEDADGDGYGNPAVSTTTTSNTAPAGYVSDNTDCNPTDDTKWRSAEMYKDDDGDSYFAILGEICYGAQVPDGYTLEPNGLLGDCDDKNPRIHGTISYYIDHDGDGIGSDQMEEICWFTNEVPPPNGYSAETGDCDDNDNTVQYSFEFYVDADGDGYGKTGTLVSVCAADYNMPPTGYAVVDGDCNDTDATVHPGAAEICGNGVDENCNGMADDTCPDVFTWYQDADGDGDGNPAISTTTPTDIAPDGYVKNSTDCDDTNAAINPTTVWYKDADNDGYSDGSTLTQCTQPASYKLASSLLATSGDCNDANAAINPAATEICGNGVDENCNGQIDENCPVDPCGGVIGVLYVNEAAPSSGSGKGWSCAIQQLRDAVTIANGDPAITQIWVGKGIYKPTSGTDRTASINITRAGLRIIGGFAGTESSAAAANPLQNLTHISGDIGIQGNVADNSLHLLRINNLPASATSLRIEGFLLENGNANLGDPATSENTYGGAAIVYNIDPATSVVFSKCVFNANRSLAAGGALGLYNTNTQIDSTAFADNTSALGGAVASYNSSPVFTRTAFIANKATGGNGGAVYAVQGSPVFNSTVFDRNSTSSNGGAVYQELSDANYNQTVFNGNTAKTGGAIYQLKGSATVSSSTLFGNTATTDGGALASSQATSVTVRNSIFWQNKKAGVANVADADITAGAATTNIQNNLLQTSSSVPTDNGSTIANNLRGIDPVFVNESAPAGTDGWFTWENDGLQLKAGSPAINVGNNSFAAGITTDIKAATRIVCTTVDLGAYEYQTCSGLITKADPIIPGKPTFTGIKANVTNPFSNRLLIMYTGADKAEVDITSLSGQKMWKGTAINKGQTVVNTATWAGGMYQVTIRTIKGQPMVFKVVKVM